MIILAVESSAVAASVAVLENEKLLCEIYSNNGLTHSVTLLPAIKSALDFCSLTAADVDVFAVSNGPGSFTGLRIGAATVKGLAGEKGCIGISTLEAMAFDHTEFDGVVCACMDARCSQFYNALFECDGKNIKRICEDRALMSSELIAELEKIDKNILLVGDGASLCYNNIKDTSPELAKRVVLPCASRLYQHAGGTALCALKHIADGEKTCSADELNLSYLRLPQAERELKKKENTK